MRSTETAGLAGVSVRTLRHYHQVGVLPEPARSANGYRDYGAGDLVHLLRVRHLADLGVPLARIDEALGVDASSDDLLDELETDLDRRLAELTRQRDVVRRLRELGGRPDLPLHLATPVRQQLAWGDQVSARSLAQERDLLLLLDLLLDPSDRAAVTAYYDGLAETDHSPAYAASLARWEAVDDSTTEAECDAIAAEIVDLSRRLLPETPTGGAATPGDADLPPLLAQYLAESMHPRQLDVLERAMRAAAGPDDARSARAP